jgi:2',3'-cyclic-nucleotide 2'-phosphodiesterase / 3'-nucleotidase / 5'-nucleotidase
MKYKTLVFSLCAALLPFTQAFATPPLLPQVELTLVGSYSSGIYSGGGAEIVAHDPLTQRLYVVNAQAASLDVLSIRNPDRPRKVTTISLLPFGGVANSVAVHDGVVAVAVEATPKTSPGKVVFFDSRLKALSAVTVGALPDMVIFSHKGGYVLVANEGEPNTYNDFGSLTNGPSIDPEGSVSIINMGGGAGSLTQADVSTATFTAYNGQEPALRAAGIRIFGPNATAAQDIEPEYITVSADDTTAWVTLQENNAIAVIDIASATVASLIPLGLKDHSLAGNAFDASDRDGASNGPAINIANWPVKGMYLPDAITSFQIGTETFLVTANEGDARDWPGFREDVRLATRNLDTNVFPNATALKANSRLGRLNVSSVDGDLDGDGDLDQIQSYGARSFTIRTAAGAVVFDSGADFEVITAALHLSGDVIFNPSHDNNTFDARSPSKGPEPEAVAVGRAFQHLWAFIGLERIGGIMVYDISNPSAARFVEYANNRNFSVTPSLANLGAVGDLGPEGLIFIDADDSPTGEPLVVIGNEISGTTTIYQVNKVE